MKEKTQADIVDGAKCKVISGVHAGKSGTITDIKTGKTGFVSITVVRQMEKDLRPWQEMLL